MADRLVLITCMMGCAFVFGLGIGGDAERGKVATRCAPQPGETLVSVHQTTAGVLCQYASAPRRAKWSSRVAS